MSTIPTEIKDVRNKLDRIVEKLDKLSFACWACSYENTCKQLKNFADKIVDICDEMDEEIQELKD